jgi:uncharacterized protein (TIGR03000 family)
MSTLRTLVAGFLSILSFAASSALAQKPNIPGYYIGGYSGGNNRGGYAGYYIGGYPTMSGRGDAGGYYIGGYPAVDPLAIPGPGYPRFGPSFRGYTTRLYPGYPEPYHVRPPTNDVATVDVFLPTDAELWFDGTRMTQAGNYRAFVTPALKTGSTYSYKVRARWTERGQVKDETREVTVRPGGRVTIDFLAK